jgi:hypothetical protein
MGSYSDNMSSREDMVKSGDSDAFKRVCVLFGVGAYLYEPDDPGAPGNRTATPAASAPTPGGSLEAVLSGRDLWMWAKDRNMLDTVVAAGRALRLPPRVVDWSLADVEAALAEIAE